MRIATKELRKALAACSLVTPTRTPDDRLHYALIHENKIIATDSETFLSHEIECESPETMLVQVATLKQICGTTSAEWVEIDTLASGIVVRCGKSKFNLPTMPPDRFPKPPEVWSVFATIDGPSLKEALDICLPHVDEISTKSGVSGVCFCFGAKGIRILAAESSGSASYWISRDKQPEAMESITARCAKSLAGLCDGPVQVGRYSGGLFFQNQKASLLSPCLAAKFPIKIFDNVLDVIFEDKPESTFAKEDLLEGLSQVGIVLSEMNGVEVKCDKSMLISSRENGAEVTAEVESISAGEPWISRYQQRCLVRAVRCLDGEIKIRHTEKAIRLQSGPKTAIVMAMSGGGQG